MGSRKRESEPIAIGRRQFLTLSSGWAMVPWLGGLGYAAAQQEGQRRYASAGRLSVGFVERSERVASFDGLPWERTSADTSGGGSELDISHLEVYPAAMLPAGDPSFAWGEAEITLFGLYGGEPVDRRRQHPLRAALEVFYAVEDKAMREPVPFLAWAFSDHPVRTYPSALRFVAPVDAKAGLRMTLRVTRPRNRYAAKQKWEEEQVLSADFTVNFEAARPKLQRGIYILGLEPHSFDRPLVLPPPDDPAAEKYPGLIFAVDTPERSRAAGA